LNSASVLKAYNKNYHFKECKGPGRPYWGLSVLEGGS